MPHFRPVFLVGQTLSSLSLLFAFSSLVFVVLPLRGVNGTTTRYKPQDGLMDKGKVMAEINHTLITAPTGWCDGDWGPGMMGGMRTKDGNSDDDGGGGGDAGMERTTPHMG